jgi:signal transduction histidine kinase/ligand-binding sensor domain-containing protein/CheY-like chemotaxis protein/HPt (histidine-containing phosphotransfer) domain-containing protein
VLCNKLVIASPLLCWAALANQAQSVNLGLDPSKSLTEFREDVWGSDEGLPQETVPAIAQTRDGYLWAGTELGLARFDGLRFTVFDKSNTPGLKSNKIDALLADRRGDLWIGTIGGGLTRLHDGTFQTFTMQEGLSNNSVLALLEDSDGNLWIGTEGGGLDCLKNGHFARYSRREGLSDDLVFALAEGIDGSIWVGTGEGLDRRINGTFQNYNSHNGLPHRNVRSLTTARDGTLWIGTNGDGLIRFRNGEFRSFTSKDGLPANAIVSLREDRRGSLWIGTGGGGICRLSGEKFSSFTTENGLPSTDVRSIFEDHDSNLWLGTAGGGLVRFFDSRLFLSFGVKQGLSDPIVLPVLEDHAGALWMGTKTGGLNRMQSGKVTQVFTTKQGLADNLVFTLCEDQSHTLWIGTRKGLNKLQNGKLTTYTQKNGLPSDIILACYSDHAGNLWIGTRNGLSTLRNGMFKNYSTEDGLSNKVVRAIYEDADNNIWLGTSGGGLNLFRNGRFEVFNTRRGLSNDVVLSIYQDRGRVFWIGTDGGGLNRMKDGKFTSYTSKDGLLDDVMFRILEDESGNLWMSSNKGVFRASRQALNDFAAGRIKRIPTYSYGKADGMATRECNGGFQPAGWKTRDGHLWFPTMQGVVSVDPSKVEIAAAPPLVAVEQILIDGKNIKTAGPARGSPGRGDLEFHYSAPNFRSPQRVTFRYQLEGFDHDWIEAGTRRTAYYTNIPPGDYRFRVRATNGEGEWSATAAVARVILPPRFYQTLWFYGLCGLVVVGLAWGGHFTHVRELQKRRTMLERAVEERTAKLQNEVAERERAEREIVMAKEAAERASSVKSEFLANMSHEIRTPMNAILGMTDLALTAQSAAEQRKCLEIVKNSGGYLLTVIDDILDFSKVEAGKLDLVPRTFDLCGMLEETIQSLAARAAQAGVGLKSEVGSGVPEVVNADPVRLRQILLNLIGNAIKFSPNGAVVLRVESAGVNGNRAHLHFSVRDTGVGIPREHLDSIFEAFSQGDSSMTKRFGGTGLGLAICSRLVRLMGGKIWVESEVGEGSEFHFTAEFEVAEKASRSTQIDPASSASQTRGTPEMPATPRFKALLAEDNPANRILARLTLKRAGFDVTEVENGIQAVEAVSRSSFDIVLMDCRMPAMDGYTATTRIRQLGGPGRQVPIIALTASAFKEDRVAAEQAGMDDFLSKPFQPSELVSKCVAWGKASRNLSAGTALSANPEELDLPEQYSRECVRELLGIFLETSPPVFRNLTRAIEERDWAEARHCAHWLRSGAVRMLSPALEEHFARIESACRNGSPFISPDDIESLEALFRMACQRAEWWRHDRFLKAALA